ncbi:MAG TPA: hypothetical protein PKZ27_02870 [Rhodocyclaceae bacterium]|nr:hypothetical protein [Burkholderiaceae bacterium]HRP74508.1 hypothetical protein [Rhodocyclaceae bacterium]
MGTENEARAARIPVLVEAYERILGEVPNKVMDPLYLASIMADMRHWCARHGAKFDELITLSAEHFVQERLE